MSETTLELQIRDNAATAVQGLDTLISALERVQRAVERGLNFTGISSGLARFGQAVNAAVTDATIARYNQLAETMERIQRASSGRGNGAAGAVSRAAQRSGWTDVTDQFISRNNLGELVDANDTVQIEKYNDTLRVLNSAVVNTQSQVQEAANEVERLNNSMHETPGEAANNVMHFRDSLRSMLQAVSPARSGLGKLLNSFMRIAKYRMLRTAIRQITEGFRFGLANVREYSKAIGSEFATAMETANNSTFKMKNSLGAALAPVIQMLIPLLQQLVSWVIAAANALNQLFSLFRGQSTWTRATDAAASSMDNVAKSAGGAAKEIEGLLADWDELNIIQSQPGSGGGGGGSAMDTDYTSMFEEVDVFDSKIRNLVSWIQDHLYVINGLVAGIAAKLLGLQAGGILISVGLALSWSAGFDMGYNGVTPDNILGAIGGALATSIGGAVVGAKLGGGVGAAVGAGLGLVISLGVTVAAYFQGLQKKRWDDLWGTIELEADQIQQFVENSFNFPVVATIDVLRTSVENKRKAQKQVNAAVLELNMTLQKIRIGVDNSPEAIHDLVEKVNGVVSSVNENLRTSTESFEQFVSIVPLFGQDANGNTIDISGEMTERFSQMNSEVQEQIKAYGEEIARWYDAGIQSGWQNNEREMIQELSERLVRMTVSAENAASFGQLYARTGGLLNNLTRDNANQILEEQMKLIDEYGAQIQEAFSQAIGMAYQNESYARSFAEQAQTEEERLYWEAKADEYKRIAEDLTKSMKESLGPAMENAIAPIREQWLEALKNLDLDYGDVFNKSRGAFKFDATQYGNLSGDMEGAKKAGERYLDFFFKGTGLDGERVRKLGLNLLDFIDLETSGNDIVEFVNWAEQRYGEYADAFIQAVTGYTKDELRSRFPNIFEEYAEAIEDQVGTVSTITDGLFQQIRTFVTGGLLSSIVNVPITLVAQPDIDDSSIVSSAELLANAMNSYFAGGNDAYYSAGEYYDQFIAGLVKEMAMGSGLDEVDAQSIANSAYDWFVDSITGTGTFSYTVDEMIQKIQQTIERAHMPAMGDADLVDGLTQTANTVETQMQRIRDAVASINGLSFSFAGGLFGGTFNVSLPAMAAEGGMFGTGELFIAREAGPELVGQIGNRTTVANNDQIVSGIAGGVAAGQEEQNALLRRQNDLLTRMLNKKFTAEVVPSAKMGRVNRMSEEMYARNTGTGV